MSHGNATETIAHGGELSGAAVVVRAWNTGTVERPGASTATRAAPPSAPAYGASISSTFDMKVNHWPQAAASCSARTRS